jgi:DNA-binding CsgD family transcriptional regulator
VIVQSRDALLRQLLADWLRRRPQVGAVVLAADVAELLRLSALCRPDAVIVDTAAEDDPGALSARLREAAGSWAVVLLAERSSVLLHLTEAHGVVQVILRTQCLAALDDLLDALPGVGEVGEPCVYGADQNSATALLTSRELDVLRLLSLGRRCAEVSAALGVSVRTVENHKRRIFAKLGVHGETQAVAEAIRLGLLRRPAAVRAQARLTPREAEIIGLAAAGRSVKQTARALNISVKTVESIQSHLYRKLGVRGRTGAVAACAGREAPDVSGKA